MHAVIWLTPLQTAEVCHKLCIQMWNRWIYWNKHLLQYWLWLFNTPELDNQHLSAPTSQNQQSSFQEYSEF